MASAEFSLNYKTYINQIPEYSPTTWVAIKAHLDSGLINSPEPDDKQIFHDLFGHLSLVSGILACDKLSVDTRKLAHILFQGIPSELIVNQFCGQIPEVKDIHDPSEPEIDFVAASLRQALVTYLEPMFVVADARAQEPSFAEERMQQIEDEIAQGAGIKEDNFYYLHRYQQLGAKINGKLFNEILGNITEITRGALRHMAQWDSLFRDRSQEFLDSLNETEQSRFPGVVKSVIEAYKNPNYTNNSDAFQLFKMIYGFVPTKDMNEADVSVLKHLADRWMAFIWETELPNPQLLAQCFIR